MKSVSMVIRSRVENQKKLASSNLINLRTYVIETIRNSMIVFSSPLPTINTCSKSSFVTFFFPFLSLYIYIYISAATQAVLNIEC